MPALNNQRWERFCQAVVFGQHSAKSAYIAAGYQARDHSAEVTSSRLLRSVEKVASRIRELQDEQKQQLAERDRFTKDALAKRMALASRIAEEDRNPSALYGAEATIAKLYGLITDKHEDVTKHDISQAKSSNDIGRMLLEGIGYVAPSAADIALACEANAQLMDTLEAIRDRAVNGALSQ